MSDIQQARDRYRYSSLSTSFAYLSRTIFIPFSPFMAMAEDGYSSSTAWENADNSDLHNHSSYGRPSFQSLESVEEHSSSAPHIMSISPQPRSSTDSSGKSPKSQPWRDNAASLTDRRDTLTTIHSGTPSLVEPTFDENVLRALCELDVTTCSILYIPYLIAIYSSAVSLCFSTE